MKINLETKSIFRYTDTITFFEIFRAEYRLNYFCKIGETSWISLGNNEYLDELFFPPFGLKFSVNR